MQQDTLAEKRPDGSNGQSMAQLAEQIEIHATELEKQRLDIKEREERLNKLIVIQDQRMNIVRKIALNGHANATPVGDEYARLGTKLGELGIRAGKHGAVSYLSGDKRSLAAIPKNIAEAILSVWDLPAVKQQPIGTTDILACLPKVGYKSNAAPESMKSSINQALAKLAADRRVVRLRADGSVISRRDGKSRARSYQRADLPLTLSERARE